MNVLSRLVAILAIGGLVVGVVKAVQTVDLREPERSEHVEAPVGERSPPPTLTETGGECRKVAEGYLETNPVIGHESANFVHASYWSVGQPSRNVLLDGSLFEREAGYGGYFWAYADCSRAYAEAQLAGHRERTGEGLGDPAPFSRLR